MHIPDSVLSPVAMVVTTLVGGIGLAICLRRIRAELNDRATARMGSMAAFLFAAQMVNFPIPLAGISGHLLGGALAAILLGPWAGAGAIAVVLLAQSLLFADGGVTALGANFINMGLIGSLGGYGIYSALRERWKSPKGILVASMVSAWFAVILAAGAFALEMAASGRLRDFFPLLGWMILVHAAIGLGEALITGFVVRYLLQTHPDWLNWSHSAPRKSLDSWSRAAFAVLAIALAIALFLAPLASTTPDGLEWVMEKLGLPNSPDPVFPSPIIDYQMPGLASNASAAVASAGLLGTLVVFGSGLILSRGLRASSSNPTKPGTDIDVA